MIDKNKKTLIFDFDGTIADTFEHILDILDQYSGDFGVELGDKSLLEDLRNLSAEELLQKFKIPKILLPIITRKVQKNLEKNINNVYSFEEVINQIRKLKDSYNIGILTSNSKKNVQAFLKKEGIEDLFAFIYAVPNLFGKHKTLNKLVEKYNLNKQDILYIGDEARDIDECNKANVKILSVGWGFNSEKLLKSKNNNYISDPKLLKEAVSKL